ncbi:MAG: RuBisCO accumulation factor 1 [Hormoscilla sp.]
MTDTEQDMLHALRRKEGSWVEWGHAIAQLQKSGYKPAQIFEDTGIEAVQQNQIVVASQVYTSILNANAPEPVLQYFQQKGSDRLYEFRILAGAERAAAAEFVVAQNLDADEAHDLARAMKDLSRMRTLPEGFSRQPGDAIAYQCWKTARQHNDLQDRSRLIAKGLKFAQTPGAREAIERLLTDFTVVPKRPAPILPVYRLESAEELPRVIPVVGELPLSAADLQAVPITDETPPFSMVKFAGQGAWVPVPGWQVVRSAEDPVAILATSDQLPNPVSGPPEPVLIIVDRSQRQWDADSYFLADLGSQLEIQWSETAPDIPLLGRVLLVVRPKRILDEDLTKDPWQVDE